MNGLLNWLQNLPETIQGNIFDSMAGLAAQSQARQQARQALIDQGQGLLSAQWNTRHMDPFSAVAEGFGGITSPVGKLPMDTASRMARAEAQGFSIDAYKGAYPFDYRTGPTYGFKNGKWQQVENIGAEPKPLEYFDTPDKPYAGFFGGQDVANRFAGYHENSTVFPVKLKFENPLVIEANGKHAGAFQFDSLAEKNGTQQEMKAFWNALGKDSKHDGVIIKNTTDEGTIYIPKDPTQIRSRFAAFDPAKINSKDLLASFGGLLGLGAAADQAQQYGIFGGQ